VSKTKKATSTKREHIVYHRDGSIWAKGQIENGKPCGYWEWFRKDGSKMRSGYFDNGAQIGEWTTYDKNGDVYKVTQMKSKQAAAKQVAAKK
jgi:antitoxin component YwqK of YwqJK toxin-antitoxin module